MIVAISWIELLRVSLLLLMAVTLLAPMGGILLARRYTSILDKKLLNILFSVFAMLVFNVLSRLIPCNEKTTWVIRLIVWGDYSASVLVAMTSVNYVFCYTTRNEDVPKRLIRAAKMIGTAGILFWMAMLPTPLVYSVDPVSKGAFGPLYLVTQIPAALLIMINAYITLKHRKQIGKRVLMVFLANAFCPLITLILLTFDIGMWRAFLAEMAVGMCVLLTCCIVHADRAEKNALRTIRMLEIRSRLVFIGLQPKFMLDTLNTIYCLCDEDEERAQNGISEFSDYLRMNIDRMQSTELVPFAVERQHTEHFLNLEKLCYEDRLQVVWDLQIPEGFRLPFLTLQPIVQNALDHGVNMRREGGTITIQARELENAFTITVSDDGVGCDADKLFAQDENENPLGLQSVRNRLKLMCGGQFTVKSIPGEGTTATIVIPKEGRRA